MKHVDGKNVGDIKLYALSTCPWCKKAKKLLDDLGVEYSFSDVDLLTGTEREEAIVTVKKWNPSASFPTIIINETKIIIGFKEQEIKEALGQ
ncbi:MAG: glutaredoxin family protein [Dehalococcoidales bacterium]|jgi:glutaredoxin-like protein NrdH|nr:glutaredoxin family protein [Dehalococcoidales bacterium]